jgi:hypothetical protein
MNKETRIVPRNTRLMIPEVFMTISSSPILRPHFAADALVARTQISPTSVRFRNTNVAVLRIGLLKARAYYVCYFSKEGACLSRSRYLGIRSVSERLYEGKREAAVFRVPFPFRFAGGKFDLFVITDANVKTQVKVVNSQVSKRKFKDSTVFHHWRDSDFHRLLIFNHPLPATMATGEKPFFT